MSDRTKAHFTASHAVRAALLVVIGLALEFGLPPVLRIPALHSWSRQVLGRFGFYELYIGCESVLIVGAVMALGRAGPGRALGELGIARLAPLGCLCCLAAIAGGCGVLLLGGAQWAPQPADSLVLFGVVGPFVEEVLFRGFLFRQMRRWAGMPFWIAAILASLLFGAGHFDQRSSFANAVMNSTITFAGGVLFSWLAERWNSIWPGFVIHAGLNLLWSLYTLGSNAVGGANGNLARVATVVIAIVLTRRLSRRYPVSGAGVHQGVA